MKNQNQKLSKKQISSLSGISIKTVRRTMKAAFLSTTKTLHDQKDIERFLIARSLIRQGYSYTQVSEYFVNRTKEKQVKQI